MIKILSLTTALLTLVLVGLGSYVRVTGAGLACPDWPLCFGEVIPPMEVGVFQEFAHRALAGVVVVLTVFLFRELWRKRREHPIGMKIGVFALVLLLIQAKFGALTVWMRLQPWVVTTHLALGTLFLQMMLLFVVGARKKPLAAPGQSAALSIATGAFVVLVVCQLLLGGYVSTGGAALACPAFPHCGFPGEKLFLPQILQLKHRFLAYVLAVVSVALLIWLVKSKRSSKRAKILAGVTVFLMALQIGTGIMNIFARISPTLSVIHQVLAQGILFHALLLHCEFNRRFFRGFLTAAHKASELSEPSPAQRAA